MLAEVLTPTQQVAHWLHMIWYVLIAIAVILLIKS